MQSPKRLPSSTRVAAISRLRHWRHARALEALRAAQAALSDHYRQIETLNTELDAVRAKRAALFINLPDAISRAQLLALKRQEHGCEIQRIDLTLEIAKLHAALEQVQAGENRARRALAHTHRGTEKIKHIGSMVNAHRNRLEINEMENDSDDYSQPT